MSLGLWPFSVAPGLRQASCRRVGSSQTGRRPANQNEAGSGGNACPCAPCL